MKMFRFQDNKKRPVNLKIILDDWESTLTNWFTPKKINGIIRRVNYQIKCQKKIVLTDLFQVLKLLIDSEE